MKKFYIGFILGVVLMCFSFVYVIQKIHINIEEKANIQWCVMMDESLYEVFGEPARNIFYVVFKVFDYPLRSFFVYSNFKNQIKFYPIHKCSQTS